MAANNVQQLAIWRGDEYIINLLANELWFQGPNNYLALVPSINFYYKFSIGYRLMIFKYRHVAVSGDAVKAILRLEYFQIPFFPLRPTSFP